MPLTLYGSFSELSSKSNSIAFGSGNCPFSNASVMIFGYRLASQMKNPGTPIFYYYNGLSKPLLLIIKSTTLAPLHQSSPSPTLSSHCAAAPWIPLLTNASQWALLCMLYWRSKINQMGSKLRRASYWVSLSLKWLHPFHMIVLQAVIYLLRITALPYHILVISYLPTKIIISYTLGLFILTG